MAASASFAPDAVGTKAGELPPWAQEIIGNTFNLELKWLWTSIDHGA